MRVLVIVCVMMCFCSCVKEEAIIDVEDFIGKYLTCDSIKITGERTEQTITKGRGTGLDIMLDTSRTYTVFSNPPKVYTYRIRKSKIYYWQKRTDPHLGDFMTIVNKNNSQLWLEYQDANTGVKTLYYYTAD